MPRSTRERSKPKAAGNQAVRMPDTRGRPQCFTQYWSGPTCDEMAETQEGLPLDHIADDRFAIAGVGRGDRVYVVSIRAGRLFLIARMEVDRRMSRAAAERQLGLKLRDAVDHLIARPGSASPMRFSRAIPDQIARQLRFENKAGPQPLAFKPDGRLDGQTLRSIRRLTHDSAQILEDLLVRDGDGLGTSEISQQEHEDAFNHRVAEALRDSTRERRARLTKADPMPRKIQVLATAYERNADVVAEVLERADGVCERCRNPAPFLKASDGRPFLEVHHRKPLATGGPDTVDNAIALCPNCHRGAHYGPVEFAT